MISPKDGCTTQVGTKPLGKSIFEHVKINVFPFTWYCSLHVKGSATALCTLGENEVSTQNETDEGRTEKKRMRREIAESPVSGPEVLYFLHSVNSSRSLTSYISQKIPLGSLINLGWFLFTEESRPFIKVHLSNKF